MTTEKRTRRTEPIIRRVDANKKTVGYEFRIDVGLRTDGKRDRRRFSFRTAEEARREFRRISTGVKDGTYVPGHSATVGEFLERWLNGRRDVRPVTLAGYRHALRPVVDRLGNVRLQDLTKAQVDELVEWRLGSGRTIAPVLSEGAAAVLEFVASHGAEGVSYVEVEAEFGKAATRRLDRLRTGGYVERPSRGRYVAARAVADPEPAAGVSPRTVVAMLVQLSAALDAAVAEGLVARNVARLVERPRVTPTEMKAWTAAEAARFRSHVAGRRDHALWLLTSAGMRRSEVLGLTWDRVDLDAGTLTVAASRVVVSGGTDTGDPKSWRSRRTLRLPEDVVAALRTLKATQAAERLAVGAALPDTGLVAVREDGIPIRPETYSAEFGRLVEAASLPRIRLHDVRHSAASVLLSAGFSAVATAKWLGHDPALTLRVYGHSADEEQDAVGRRLFGSP